ncbi:MAG: hypothetical protein WCI74_06240, partial [Actinomycetes bacterium]
MTTLQTVTRPVQGLLPVPYPLVFTWGAFPSREMVSLAASELVAGVQPRRVEIACTAVQGDLLSPDIQLSRGVTRRFHPVTSADLVGAEGRPDPLQYGTDRDYSA